jgi:hypothetical protein
MRDGAISPKSDKVPEFTPSFAQVPHGFEPLESAEADLEFALGNPCISFQSFFNDLELIRSAVVDDDVISLPCFDEDMYSRLVKEMHRYTLAEVSDRKDSLAKDNARLGTFVGALLGVFTMNPLAPFLGRNYGRLETDRGQRVAEFLPDPHLLFYQDEHSFLSWSRAQVVAPKIRRIIISRIEKDDGRIYFRLIPAMVTADSVLPIQLFKLEAMSYFYRPFVAGIARHQSNYDAVKIQRRYMHTRAQGRSMATSLELRVGGLDIEPYKANLSRFEGPSLDYFYMDFKNLPGHVF